MPYHIAFDTSHKAIVFSEIKIAGLKAFDRETFKQFFVDKSNQPEKTSFEDSLYKRFLSPQLSDYTRSIFDPLFKENNPNSMCSLYNCRNIFRSWGFAAPNIDSTLYLEDDE